MNINFERFSRKLLIGIFVCHILFLLSRIPGQVYSKRFKEMTKWEKAGGTFGWHTRGKNKPTLATLNWLLENTSPDAVIPYEDEVLELDLPFSLLFASIPPRLLVKTKVIPDPAQGYMSRPIARGTLPTGTEGWIYLVRKGDQLVLEAR